MESQGTPEPTTNFDYDPQSFLCENQALTLATFTITILYPLVLLLSLVGNSLVLWVLVKYESLESLTNLFILNLCLSDLVFSCLLPVLYSSIFFLTIMTVHRYLSVVSPLSTLRVHTLRCRALVTTAVWVASALSSIPDAVFHKVVNSQCTYAETRGLLASVYQHNIFFLLSMATILFCYVQILRTLFRSRSKQRHRTIRLIFTIVVAYFLSWAPYNLILFLQTLEKVGVIQSCETSQQLHFALLLCRHLAFSQCCFNPVLYVFVGVKFRKHLKSLLQQVRPCHLQAPSPPPMPRSPGAFAYEGPSFY
ncbi:chemokine XC receptor 1 isoform X2 [Octodon degus]|uniref:Chemokine XC receptor 1 isoform X2 n=1 Tax=Octodon degus TaxID=10160 RepID=A0A6P6D8S2_OCTDE|nr:chemokine XC receptor 1 isoform X2 [Octodon degus]